MVIRGLNFVRSEFNGRDTFSTGVGGQAINFADVPAELLGSVAVYKNATAEMIEGGLAGTVDLNTRLPFDNKGFHISFDAEDNYGDFEQEVGADRLAADQRHLGHRHRPHRPARRRFLFAPVQPRRRHPGHQLPDPRRLDRDCSQHLQHSGSAATSCRPTPTRGFRRSCQARRSDRWSVLRRSAAGANGLADCGRLPYAPLGGQFRTQDYDRKRRGIAAAAQWESLDQARAADRPVPALARERQLGRAHVRNGPDLSEYNTYPARLPRQNSRNGCRSTAASHARTRNARPASFTELPI